MTRPAILLLALVSPWILAVTRAPSTDAEVTYLRTSLHVGGHVLASSVTDIEGDGRNELVIASYSPTRARRELHVFRLDAAGNLPPEPSIVVPVLSDVVAWGWADVREESGRELVFLTPTGAWSYSLTRDGYRDNIRRLVQTELLYDVPDVRTLPTWNYVVQGTERDSLLLPTRQGYTVWGPAATEGTDEYVAQAEFALELTDDSEPDQDSIRIVEGRIEVRRGAGIDLPGRADAQGLLAAPLLSTSVRHRSPALVDVDGDGRKDLLRKARKHLHVHLNRTGVIGADADRAEPYPDYLQSDDTDLEFALRDVDGDGDVDVIARLQAERTGFLDTRRTFTFLVLVNDGDRLLPETPDQILRFEGTYVRADTADIDGDGRADLVVTKLQAPGLGEIGTTRGVTFVRTIEVFLHGDDAPFERRPTIKIEARFDESTMDQAITRRQLGWDCDGDGLADLIDVDAGGRISIFRMTHRKSLFGAASWALEDVPWKRFASSGSMTDFRLYDLNGDGLGDVVSALDDRLTVLLSRRPLER